MTDDRKYELITEQQLLRGMMGGTDSCTNCLAMFKIHGKVDNARLERAVQKTIDKEPGLRLVFETSDDGRVLQHLGGEYRYKLDLRDISTAEDVQAELKKQMFTMIDEHTHFDGSFMFNFTLFCLAEEEYLFVSCVNHIVSDGTSNNIIAMKIIANYNGIEDNEEKLTYIDYLEESARMAQSGELDSMRSYWEKECEGYENKVTMPTGERKKYPARILQKIDADSVRKVSSEFSVSAAAVNLFLCHLAYSASLRNNDIAINVAEQNRSRKFRRTVGTFAITLFHRLRFNKDTNIHQALKDSFAKLNENFDNSRVLAPARTPFIFSYENFLGREDGTLKLGDAPVESYRGTLEAKVWNIFSMLVFEDSDYITYKVGYDEEVFDEAMIARFKKYFDAGLQVLQGEDMTYEDFLNKYGTEAD
ncbi:MAG: hypothetical protein K6F49_08740 [Saccharofermentans sp.]|nr:hypothetical protein [Saccharofermentans sp.]